MRATNRLREIERPCVCSEPECEDRNRPLSWREVWSLGCAAILCGYLLIQGVKLAVWLGGFIWP